MVRWSLSTALIALFLAGCDMPLDGLRDSVDAAASADAEGPDTYAPPPVRRVDSGAETTPDASHTSLEDGSADGNDAHPIEAGAPDAKPPADAEDDSRDDDVE
jgi:hypothetical protein